LGISESSSRRGVLTADDGGLFVDDNGEEVIIASATLDDSCGEELTISASSASFAGSARLIWDDCICCRRDGDGDGDGDDDAPLS
jgi:hypothetical protein